MSSNKTFAALLIIVKMLWSKVKLNENVITESLVCVMNGNTKFGNKYTTGNYFIW